MNDRTETSELSDLLNVKFGRSVGFSELQQMLAVVSRRANCEVDYHANFMGSMGKFDPESGGAIPSDFYATGLRGGFRKGVLGSVSFQIGFSNDYDNLCGVETRAISLKFLTTPGYNTVQSLANRDTDSLEVIRSVTGEIREYFQPK